MSVIGADDQAVFAGILQDSGQVIVRLTGHIDPVFAEHIVGELPALSLIGPGCFMVDLRHPLRGRFDESPAKLQEQAREVAHQQHETGDPRWVPGIGRSHWCETSLVLQRGFIPVGSPVRCGACGVSDRRHGFAVGDRRGCPAPTACQTHVWVRLPPTPAPPGAASPLGRFLNRRLRRTTTKCARLTNVRG